MELARLFFAGLAQPQQRIAAIQNYLSQMEETRLVLCAIQDNWNARDWKTLPPDTDWAQVLPFQGYTLQYGIAAAEFEISRYRQLLKKLEEQP